MEKMHPTKTSDSHTQSPIQQPRAKTNSQLQLIRNKLDTRNHPEYRPPLYPDQNHIHADHHPHSQIRPAV